MGILFSKTMAAWAWSFLIKPKVPLPYGRGSVGFCVFQTSEAPLPYGRGSVGLGAFTLKVNRCSTFQIRMDVPSFGLS